MESERCGNLKKEFKRKAFHQLTLLYWGAYLLLGRERVLIAMAAWTALVGAGEALRFRTPWANRLVNDWFGGMMREKEARRLTGMFYGSLGMFATVLWFGRDAAVVTAAILYLAFGDAAAGLVGVGIGRCAYFVMGSRRTLEGGVAGFVTAAAVGWAVGFPVRAALGGALAFSLIDALSIPPDDNLWIPLAGAAALHWLR